MLLCRRNKRQFENLKISITIILLVCYFKKKCEVDSFLFCFVFQRAGEGQTSAGEESWQESLASFSFLHSINLLCAEYLISTPFISSTEGMGQCWPTRHPIHSRTQQRWYSKHGSLPATRRSLAELFPPKKRASGSEFRRPSHPRIPCDRLLP